MTKGFAGYHFLVNILLVNLCMNTQQQEKILRMTKSPSRCLLCFLAPEMPDVRRMIIGLQDG
jgi:hypothetical protein